MRQTPSINVARMGQPIEASQWNLIRSAILSVLQDGGVLDQLLTEHLPSSVDMFRIKSSNGDYWICRRYDGTTEGVKDYRIAKPFELRPSVTALGTQTYVYSGDGVRTATDGPDNEIQVVVPTWVIDQTVIWAALANETGVVATVSGDDKKVEWLDVNAAGRAWAKAAE